MIDSESGFVEYRYHRKFPLTITVICTKLESSAVAPPTPWIQQQLIWLEL